MLRCNTLRQGTSDDASELDAYIGNETNLEPFLLSNRRTNSSSQPSSRALVSLADRLWPPTDKPRPRRNTSVRKPKQAELAPQAALL